jgi:acyl-CoA thioester hydrolase
MLGAMTAFRYRLRVRYGECDAQKIVYNARYGEYVDLAATEFLRAVWGDAMFGGGFDYRLVKQVIEWRAPARWDDVVEIAVSSGGIGTSSFSLAMTLRVLGADQPAVTAETTYVLVAEVAQTKLAMPDDLRARLVAGATDVLIDHAGSTAALRGAAPHGSRDTHDVAGPARTAETE